MTAETQEPTIMTIDGVLSSMNAINQGFDETRYSRLRAERALAIEDQLHERAMAVEMQRQHREGVAAEEQTHETAVEDIQGELDIIGSRREELDSDQRGILKDVYSFLEQKVESNGEISISDFLLIHALNSRDPQEALFEHLQMNFQLEEIARMIRDNEEQLFLRYPTTFDWSVIVGRTAPGITERGFAKPNSSGKYSQEKPWTYYGEQFYSPDGLFSYEIVPGYGKTLIRVTLGTDLQIQAKRDGALSYHIGVRRVKKKGDVEGIEYDHTENALKNIVLGDENVARELSRLAALRPEYESAAKKVARMIVRHHDRNFRIKLPYRMTG